MAQVLNNRKKGYWSPHKICPIDLPDKNALLKGAGRCFMCVDQQIVQEIKLVSEIISNNVMEIECMACSADAINTNNRPMTQTAQNCCNK